MLQIGKNPINALREGQCRTFQQRLLEQFAALHGPADGDHGLAERMDLIAATQRMATRYNLDDEHSTALLANLLYLYGADLDLRADLPWVRQILDRPHLPAPIRAAQLERRCRELLAGAAP